MYKHRYIYKYIIYISKYTHMYRCIDIYIYIHIYTYILFVSVNIYYSPISFLPFFFFFIFAYDINTI